MATRELRRDPFRDLASSELRRDYSDPGQGPLPLHDWAAPPLAGPILLKALQGAPCASIPDPVMPLDRSELVKGALDGPNGLPWKRLGREGRGRGNSRPGDGKRVRRVKTEGCNRLI